jgi:hypothetical protein
MSANTSGEMGNHDIEPSIDASYKASLHLAKRLFLINRPIRNKNYLWRPYLLMDRDKLSNHYRGPCIDASCQVMVYLAKRFQRRNYLEIGQSETRIACDGHAY